MKVLTVPQIRIAEENAVLNGIFSYSQMMWQQMAEWLRASAELT